jgi:hypothetical protein
MLGKEFGPRSPLLERAASLEFDTRHMTGTGYYVTFLNSKELPRMNNINTEISEDYRTNRNAPCDIVGFTLFIRDGYLSSFEGYTFGDVKWPDDVMEKWLVLDSA